MPELHFEVTGAAPMPHAAAPTLAFRLVLSQGRPARPIRGVTLQCQLRIDTRKRSYTPMEQDRLLDLFGEPSRWGQTLHSMLWMQTSIAVPPFERDCEVELPIPCSFDFNLAATKYFHGLADGEVPLLLLFSGSVFYLDADGALAMEQIAWDKETAFRLPVATWQAMIDRYYPNHAWVCLNRQVFEALYEYKRRHGHTGFDQALASLLPVARREAS